MNSTPSPISKLTLLSATTSGSKATNTTHMLSIEGLEVVTVIALLCLGDYHDTFPLSLLIGRLKKLCTLTFTICELSSPIDVNQMPFTCYIPLSHTTQGLWCVIGSTYQVTHM